MPSLGTRRSYLRALARLCRAHLLMLVLAGRLWPSEVLGPALCGTSPLAPRRAQSMALPSMVRQLALRAPAQSSLTRPLLDGSVPLTAMTPVPRSLLLLLPSRGWRPARRRIRCCVSARTLLPCFSPGRWTPLRAFTTLARTRGGLPPMVWGSSLRLGVACGAPRASDVVATYGYLPPARVTGRRGLSVLALLRSMGAAARLALCRRRGRVPPPPRPSLQTPNTGLPLRTRVRCALLTFPTSSPPLLLTRVVRRVGGPLGGCGARMRSVASATPPCSAGLAPAAPSAAARASRLCSSRECASSACLRARCCVFARLRLVRPLPSLCLL